MVYIFKVVSLVDERIKARTRQGGQVQTRSLSLLRYSQKKLNEANDGVLP